MTTCLATEACRACVYKCAENSHSAAARSREPSRHAEYMYVLADDPLRGLTVRLPPREGIACSAMRWKLKAA